MFVLKIVFTLDKIVLWLSIKLFVNVEVRRRVANCISNNLLEHKIQYLRRQHTTNISIEKKVLR
jgi:hypothetical protein